MISINGSRKEGTDIVCTYNAEEPVVKQIDAWEGDVPVTVKRFPSSPLD